MMEHERYQREIEDLKADCHRAEKDVEEEIEMFRYVCACFLWVCVSVSVPLFSQRISVQQHGVRH